MPETPASSNELKSHELHPSSSCCCVPDVRWNKLREAGGAALLNALRTNSTLLRLELEGNLIDRATIDAIGKLHRIPTD